MPQCAVIGRPGQTGQDSPAATKVNLDPHSRLTLEVSRPGEAMRVYDVAGIDVEADRAVVRLTPRAAICKPRHRASTHAATACCA
jgi:hypothetical protein